ncbi:MAG: hypothetical protein WBD10_03915, partial [Acidobacteriaceae bacterium]
VSQFQQRLLLHQRRKLRGSDLSHVKGIDGAPLYEFTGYRKKGTRPFDFAQGKLSGRTRFAQ